MVQTQPVNKLQLLSHLIYTNGEDWTDQNWLSVLYKRAEIWKSCNVWGFPPLMAEWTSAKLTDNAAGSSKMKRIFLDIMKIPNLQKRCAHSGIFCLRLISRPVLEYVSEDLRSMKLSIRFQWVPKLSNAILVVVSYACQLPSGSEISTEVKQQFCRKYMARNLYTAEDQCHSVYRTDHKFVIVEKYCFHRH